jgi:hypothetical protein
VPDARVSTPLTWDEVPDVEPSDFTIRTVPERVRTVGDPGSDIDAHVGSLEPLLELAARDAAGGLSDAPWPPHFPKGDDEPVRASPSRRRWAEWAEQHPGERPPGGGAQGRRPPRT